MASNHTFGESCMLREESNTFTRRASSIAIESPKITAQFFYCSALAIDDPLAAVPIPSSSSATKPSRVPPRPFSVYDNLALEQAWLKLPKTPQPLAKASTQKQAKTEKDAIRSEGSSPEFYAATIPARRSLDGGQPESAPPVQGNFPSELQTIGGRKSVAPAAMYEENTAAKSDGNGSTLQSEHDLDGKARLIHGELGAAHRDQPLQEIVPVSVEELEPDEAEKDLRKTHRNRNFFHRKEKEDGPAEDMVSSRSSPRRLSRGRQEGDDGAITMGRSPDTTGTPFLRVPARLRRSRSRTPHLGPQNAQVDGALSPERDYRPKQASPLGTRPRFPRSRSSQDSQDEDGSGSDRDTEGQSAFSRHHKKLQHVEAVNVTVGISRLHVVEMPSLKVRRLHSIELKTSEGCLLMSLWQMGPIYWDPVHDISSVVRGTWFYKDTMWPVESDVANRIEEGYEYIKPWTPTYVDELNSCMEIGPEAELKVVHRIWPAEEPEIGLSRPGTDAGRRLTTEEKDRQGALETAALASNRAAGILEGFEVPGTGRLYARSSIIYANGRDAQILKSSQLPSAGKRQLGNIRKGKPVGIPIVRGFDMKAWEKINHLPNRAAPNPKTSPTGTVRSLSKQKSCLACENAQAQPMPTDLILVVHGIGQKLSERVESFHFTHAINAFRRQVNLELNEEVVKPWLRHDLEGVMVLPINWRSNLKLDSGELEQDPNQKVSSSAKNQFTLKDITAESLPAVRNLISDVMLDIPYYLSHHKPKMIEAVISEANRVYRLWCSNNQSFHQSGRVHLLAHSLGSVMALDILSKQPTELPEQVDFPNMKGRIRNDIFEFDTKSLFFCGSPAGFFLLLNRAPLVPRKGRMKPDTETAGANGGVGGSTGTFGCLAVDNIYNIMHYNDPVAYCLNACVDVDYATSLKPAFVPSASTSWGQYLGSYFRGKATVSTGTMTGLSDLPKRPTTARLPTSVEMETHDFTREEIAEKRMLLLNDNGQIDFTLPSGGGPLEIQYLNMLGAHSSYWTRRDFVRFLVVEVGRKPGKTETLNNIKAVKKPFGKK